MILSPRQKQVLGYVESAHAYWGDPRRAMPLVGYANMSTSPAAGIGNLMNSPTWVPGVTVQQISDECGEPVAKLSPTLGQLRKLGAVQKLVRATVGGEDRDTGTVVHLHGRTTATAWALTDAGDSALRDYGVTVPLPAPAPQTLIAALTGSCRDPEADECVEMVKLIQETARPALRQLALDLQPAVATSPAARRMMTLRTGVRPAGDEDILSDALEELLSRKLIKSQVAMFEGRLLTALSVISDVCEGHRPADDTFILAVAVADGQLVAMAAWLGMLAECSPKALASVLASVTSLLGSPGSMLSSSV